MYRMFKIQIKKINYKGQLFLIFIILFLFQNISIALEEKKVVKISLPILNVNRSVGAMLSSEIARN